jgi:hypothetical protein
MKFSQGMFSQQCASVVIATEDNSSTYNMVSRDDRNGGVRGTALAVDDRGTHRDGKRQGWTEHLFPCKTRKGQWRAQQQPQRMAGTAALSSFLSLIRLKCLRLDGCYRSRIPHLAGIGALSAAQICYGEHVSTTRKVLQMDGFAALLYRIFFPGGHLAPVALAYFSVHTHHLLW